MNSTHHTYGKLNGFSRLFFFLLSIILIVAGSVYLVGWIQALINHNTSSASTFFWYFAGCAVWSPLVFTFASYLFSDVAMNDEGLQTKFLFKNLLIKWEDITEVKPSRPFGLRVGKRGSVLIARNNLPFFHRIYGLIYGQTN